ncbi:cytochrome bb' ubiquinol oxidase, subunit I [Candidatus Hydrogenisulfobacillus filiaventi]|uniref:Cytochrome bb' ubiquinol oxidase, subunit I n=1 Tax=Candidatus Hydrogenisulfobacillus filiaventi TaxID=2707344 RepID=A0A6F8ZFK8_9FIRM|nr:cytochrome ubiquinol oxidase subunit I [Bacillota bacterium]CAB1128450.1 cytochrome bb' ubiquinol oxidase, subunit I [Candidatus Hydrogenisulfobacillus filiaventi]
MTQLGLARLQFGVTTVYHFLFVPLTIGISFLIAIMETQYYVTKKPEYRQLAQYWGKLFLINFAIGVVTGILQEFQFGLDWANYSRFVGDIFGAPLAVEALLAFFMESTFIGVWVFGWDRVSKGVHLAAIWLVALGTSLSALWILTANSFMQEPVGYVIAQHKAEMASFGALLANPQLWREFPHVIMASWLTASVFVLAVSSYQILKKRNVEAFKHSFRLAAIVGAIASVLVIVIGDMQASHLRVSEPMKLAASEAVFNTTGQHAPWKVFAIVNGKTEHNSAVIEIPDMLSLLAYKSTTGSIEGINQIQAQYVKKYGPGNYVPPVAPVFYTFRLMILAGTLMLIMTWWALFLLKGDRYVNRPRFLKLMEWTLILPYLANISGWIMTEVGRQPWVVYGLLKTADGVSPPVTVPAGDIAFSVIVFTLTYGLMAGFAVYLFRKYADTDLGPATAEGEVAEGAAYTRVV